LRLGKEVWGEHPAFFHEKKKATCWGKGGESLLEGIFILPQRRGKKGKDKTRNNNE